LQTSFQSANLFLGRSTAFIDAAFLLNPAQISESQAVIFLGVLTCGLQAMLRDGGAHLLALTGVWTILRETLCRQHRDQGND
jgi:hypothetical protein